MPYYHNNCRGQIRWFPFLPIPPKCLKCKERWPWWIVYGPKRRDMIYLPPEIPTPKRGTTSYSKWADSSNTPPGVAFIASRLPSWPRWLRITSLLSSIIVLSGAFYGSYLLGWWVVILLIVLLVAVLPILLLRRRNK
ncbi:hypothetical protein LCGC14_1631180 [marine sediment metagenome]|uniref:Uncharacterized protein n=1 Tax=marine sediment metagenome TaxID=412755 RepID=A0A0F9I2K6_9ZZZZ